MAACAAPQLSQLAERAWHSDKIVVTRAGNPYVDLLPRVETPLARKPGRLKGKTRMALDFGYDSRARH